MKILFLSHIKVFDQLAQAMVEHAGVKCCVWEKCVANCPMTDPDAIILDSLSLCLTYEEERAMGITSKPLRCVYMMVALRSKGGPMSLDWRMFMFNNRFLTPAMCDQEDFDEEVEKTGLPDEKITFDYMPLFTTDFVNYYPERVGFNYDSNPFVVGQTIQFLTNKDSLMLKRACVDTGAKLDLVYGLKGDDLAKRRATFHMSFDQVRRGNIGRSCFESMSHGIPTMAWAKPSTLAGLAELGSDFPIINVRDKVSLEAEILKYMADRQALAEIGRAQAAWMRDYYNAKMIAAFWKTKMEKLLEERNG